MRLKNVVAGIGLASVMATGVAPKAQAQTPFSTTVPEFNGSYNTSGFPIYFLIDNSFGFLNGQQLFSLVLSGTFGNTQAGSSAGTDVFFGNILVAQCVRFAACYYGTVPWAYTFTAADLASFSAWAQSNSVTYWANQTSEYVIRLAPTSIRGTYGGPSSVVPEPASMGLMATGLVVLGAITYRRRRLNR